MKPSLLQTLLEDQKALSVRFQPIFRLSPYGNQVDGMEGLIRGPAGTSFERADVLFDYVRRKHAETAVDRSCIVAICRAVADLPPNTRINLNVHASTLGENPDFVDFFRRQMHSLSLPLERFTLEIVEHAPNYNVPGLACNLRALRDLGVRIALDDVGLGTSNYRMILDCHPDYFKVDAYFVEGISRDADRRAVVRSVLCLAKEMNAGGGGGSSLAGRHIHVEPNGHRALSGAPSLSTAVAAGAMRQGFSGSASRRGATRAWRQCRAVRAYATKTGRNPPEAAGVSVTGAIPGLRSLREVRQLSLGTALITRRTYAEGFKLVIKRTSCHSQASRSAGNVSTFHLKSLFDVPALRFSKG